MGLLILHSQGVKRLGTFGGNSLSLIAMYKIENAEMRDCISITTLAVRISVHHFLRESCGGLPPRTLA